MRHYGLPRIRRFPTINKYGYYEVEDMKDVILANESVIYDGVIGGGRGDRLKTGESQPGLYRVNTKKDGDNQAVKDSLDCQKKASSQKCNRSI